MLVCSITTFFLLALIVKFIALRVAMSNLTTLSSTTNINYYLSFLVIGSSTFSNKNIY
jgi:hypothetical protein